MESCGLRDFGFEGHQFTWEKSRGMARWVEEKLDRILVTDDWIELFGEAKASSVEAACSDHLPLVLWPVPSIRFAACKRFCFENVWLKEEQCRDIIVHSWNTNGNLDIMSKITICSNNVGVWVVSM